MLVSTELKDRLASIDKDQRSIYQKAKEAGRTVLNADEEKRFNKFEEEYNSVKNELERTLKLEARKLEDVSLTGKAEGKRNATSTGKYNVNYITRDSVKNLKDESEIRLGDFMRVIADKKPRNDAEQRSLDGSVDASGGYIVPEQLSSRLQLALVNYSTVMRAGAQMLDLTQMDGDTFKYAKVSTNPTIAYYGQNDTIAHSDPVFGVDTISPKKAATGFLVPNELLADGIDTSEKLQSILIQAAAEAIDSAALIGTGSGNQPTGLVNISGLNSVIFGASDGAAPTNFDELVEGKYEIMNSKGDASNLSVVWHPRTARDYAKLKDSQLQPLQMPTFISGTNFYESQAISITETAGTGTDLSEAVMGNFSNLIVANRLRPQIFVDPYSKSQNDQTYFRIVFRIDVAVTRPEHFTLFSNIASA
jgi:HK97 family phage major capsid protein